MNRNARKLAERNQFLEENREEMINDRKSMTNMYLKLHNDFMKTNEILG